MIRMSRAVRPNSSPKRLTGVTRRRSITPPRSSAYVADALADLVGLAAQVAASHGGLAAGRRQERREHAQGGGRCRPPPRPAPCASGTFVAGRAFRSRVASLLTFINRVVIRINMLLEYFEIPR